ncbi:type IV secretion system protein VirD4 [Aureimonas phyllosphaerae]|nr:type IV secretion system protein VirD4 [Aureimonas phyllosphaerae]
MVPKDLDRTLIDGVKVAGGLLLRWKANQAYKDALPVYGAEVAEQVHKAVLNRRDPGPIFERADRLARERAERERLLASPPPLHGSASFTPVADLAPMIRGREGLDHPTSLILGTVRDQGRDLGQLHWDGRGGHLLTVASTRTGKGHSAIIPNLLRYQGSCIVLDPKGELYALTSKHRRTFGKVYRLAPLDDGSNPDTADWLRHGFNPLTRITSEIEARTFAQAIMPKDPKSPEFFNDDAVAFLTGLILYVVQRFDHPQLRSMVAVLELLGGTPQEFHDDTLVPMSQWADPTVRAAAEAVLSKSGRNARDPLSGFAVLRETLATELAIWRAPSVQTMLAGSDVDFTTLKDEVATVYIDVPFHQMGPYAPVLQVILQNALDAMVANRRIPERHVLFLLDEFLAIGGFPTYRAAINSHGGAGVRFWFFIQNFSGIQENYPGTAWRTFFDTAVRQFFGINESLSQQELSRELSNRTVAYRSTSESGSLGAPIGWDQGQGNYGSSTTESIQFTGRPLRTPEEVARDLAPWKGEDHRGGYVRISEHNVWADVEMYGYQHPSWGGFFTARTGALRQSDV